MACLIWSYSLYDVSVEYQGWCVLQVTLQVVIDKAAIFDNNTVHAMLRVPCAAHHSPTAVAGLLNIGRRRHNQHTALAVQKKACSASK